MHAREHRRHPRHRRAPRDAVPGARASQGHDAQAPARRQPAAAGAQHRGDDLGRAGARPRPPGRHRPPRSQAGQHLHHHVRRCEGPRLRHRPVSGPAGQRCAPHPDDRARRGGEHVRHRRQRRPGRDQALHGPGAVGRRRRRPSRRHLGRGCDPVPAGHRRAAVREPRGHGVPARRHLPARAGAQRDLGGRRPPPGAGRHHRSLPAQGEGGAVRQRTRAARRARAAGAPPRRRGGRRPLSVSGPAGVPGERRGALLRPRRPGGARGRPARDAASDLDRRSVGRRQVVVRARRSRPRAQARGRVARDHGAAGALAASVARRAARPRARARSGPPPQRRGAARRRARVPRRHPALVRGEQRLPRAPLHRPVRGALHAGPRSGRAGGLRRLPARGGRRSVEPGARRAVAALRFPRPRGRGRRVHAQPDRRNALPGAARPGRARAGAGAARRAGRPCVRVAGAALAHGGRHRDGLRRASPAPVRGRQDVGGQRPRPPGPHLCQLRRDGRDRRRPSRCMPTPC